jgi:hypothetical protein
MYGAGGSFKTNGDAGVYSRLPPDEDELKGMNGIFAGVRFDTG